MIVADSNVLAYLWLPGQHTVTAQAVWDIDPDWHVPLLWRAELRSILVGFWRRSVLDQAAVEAVMSAMEHALGPTEHAVTSAAIFEVARRSPCSAYDCEFVALAETLDVTLVTEDRQVLAAFPQRALRMADYITQHP